MLEEGESLENIEITLFPPEDGQKTDEESGDENEVDLNHLPGNILEGEVEVSAKSSTIKELTSDGNESIELTSLFEPGPPEIIPYEKGGATLPEVGAEVIIPQEDTSESESVEPTTATLTSCKRGKKLGRMTKKKKKIGGVDQQTNAEATVGAGPSENTGVTTRSRENQFQAGPSNMVRKQSSKKKSNIEYTWVEDELAFIRVGNGDAKERYNKNHSAEKSCV